MKVAIIGSRGIPAGYGGFETLAEELSVRLKNKVNEVTVICENSSHRVGQYKGVSLLYSDYSKAMNPVRFYIQSLKMASVFADVIMVCGVGGAIYYPLLHKRGRIITHVDGREELRGKYSAVKKLYVRIAQEFAARFSAHLIADSFAIRKHWINNHQIPDHKISAIEFGADPEGDVDDTLLRELQLAPGSYFLVVCRMVPENNPGMILKGFAKSGSNKNLLLVGDAEEKFGKILRDQASSGVIFSRSIYDKKLLFSLRKNCYAYIHGHSVGGTNPSLLEGMAAGNICICHDNEFNRETTHDQAIYFKNEDELAVEILKIENFSLAEKSTYSKNAVQRISEYYNWERITDEYVKLFQNHLRR